MVDIIVRRLGAEVKRRLKRRAMDNGRSLEAEARSILEAAVSPQGPSSQNCERDLAIG